MPFIILIFIKIIYINTVLEFSDVYIILYYDFLLIVDSLWYLSDFGFFHILDYAI